MGEHVRTLEFFKEIEKVEVVQKLDAGEVMGYLACYLQQCPVVERDVKMEKEFGQRPGHWEKVVNKRQTFNAVHSKKTGELKRWLCEGGKLQAPDPDSTR